VSLVTQAFGFAILGSLMALHEGSDCATKIGGFVALFTGTIFLGVTIAYRRACHRQTGERLGIRWISGVASNAPAAAILERRSIRPTRREKLPRRQIAGTGGELLAAHANA
jgi:hypothetical protein